ncbi:ligase-associated DNA damage response exonuclease [Lichenihabitans psoromatis]|uniref:ligase-associated DNA damage response exonuclease n=1 Tax=Lichenihabitans psoromatis TaxID=2528642 RepID=UPI001036BE15|nr:ligase-associated DNA damage response exonuclease [Lichenihabitans psoromatis]
MSASDVLTLTPAGLYCPAGDFFVDPVRPVERALITHGHSDHARAGHGAVMATPETLAIMATRYGEDFTGTRQSAELGVIQTVGGVEVSFHPAGHVLGSAQISIIQAGFRVVVSGDYKRASDPTCLPFEPLRCHAFITEATFGLPVFRHPDAAGEVVRLLASQSLFPERTHIVGAYALGKAQRVMALLRQAGDDRPIHIHGALERLTDLYRSLGIDLGDVRRVVPAERKSLAGQIVLCPPGAIKDVWAQKFPDPMTVAASGWMRVRARARQSGVELPLIISDHADWDELCATVIETGCSELWVTHGEADALVYWATARGLDAQPLHMIGYGDEADDEPIDPPAAA